MSHHWCFHVALFESLVEDVEDESINNEDEESINDEESIKKEQDECEAWINEHMLHNDIYDYMLASDINSTSLNKQLIIELLEQEGFVYKQMKVNKQNLRGYRKERII